MTAVYARQIVEAETSARESADRFIAALDQLGKGKRSRVNNAGTMETWYTWVMPDGVKVSGVPCDSGFHIDRLEVPASRRRQGLARHWLAKLGRLADQTGTALSGTALPDQGSSSGFHRKWITTMRDAGFTTDYDYLAGLSGQSPEEIKARNYKWHDELIRHPKIQPQ